MDDNLHLFSCSAAKIYASITMGSHFHTLHAMPCPMPAQLFLSIHYRPNPNLSLLVVWVIFSFHQATQMFTWINRQDSPQSRKSRLKGKRWRLPCSQNCRLRYIKENKEGDKITQKVPSWSETIWTLNMHNERIPRWYLHALVTT